MRRHDNRGFTLLELTCALFIITVAGFGAIQLYSIGLDKIMMMREYDVAAAPGGPPGLKEVTVTLRWQSRHGRWITRSLTTLIADKDTGATS